MSIIRYIRLFLILLFLLPPATVFSANSPGSSCSVCTSRQMESMGCCSGMGSHLADSAGTIEAAGDDGDDSCGDRLCPEQEGENSVLLSSARPGAAVADIALLQFEALPPSDAKPLLEPPPLHFHSLASLYILHCAFLI